MTKKRSMVGFLVLVVALIFVTTSVYGGAREVRARYGPGYEKWIGTLIPEEFDRRTAELGMPLYANDKTRGVGHRHPFDYAIFAACLDNQSLGQLVDRLAV